MENSSDTAYGLIIFLLIAVFFFSALFVGGAVYLFTGETADQISKNDQPKQVTQEKTCEQPVIAELPDVARMMKPYFLEGCNSAVNYDVTEACDCMWSKMKDEYTVTQLAKFSATGDTGVLGRSYDRIAETCSPDQMPQQQQQPKQQSSANYPIEKI